MMAIIVVLLSIWAVMVFMTVYGWDLVIAAYGDDTEDKGLPTPQSKDSRMDLMERLHEWNINKAINQTLELPILNGSYCAISDNVLEYCLLNYQVISCSENMTSCIEAQQTIQGYCKGNLTGLDREFCDQQ